MNSFCVPAGEHFFVNADARDYSIRHEDVKYIVNFVLVLHQMASHLDL